MKTFVLSGDKISPELIGIAILDEIWWAKLRKLAAKTAVELDAQIIKQHKKIVTDRSPLRDA